MRSKLLTLCTFVLVVTIGLRAQQSFNGTFSVTVELPMQVARGPEEETIWTFTVRDRSGNIMTEVHRSIPYDVAAPSPVVFENGRVLLLHSFDAYGEIYDQAGDLVHRFPLVAEPDPDYERVVRFAPHESIALVAVAEQGKGVRILAIDSDGIVSERKTIEAMTVTGLAVAQDPDVVAVGTMSWRGDQPYYETTMLEHAEEWSVGVGFTKGIFTDGNGFVGIHDGGVFRISRDDRSVEWEQRIATGRMLIDAMVADGTVSVLTAEKPKWFEGGWVYLTPRREDLDATGAVLKEVNLGRPSFSKGAFEVNEGTVVVRLDGTIVE